MRKETREGVELEISELGDGIERIEAINWPGGLTYYTDEEIRRLTGKYTPGIVWYVYGDEYHRAGSSRIGKMFPPDARELEKVVLPVVAVSRNLGEFAGFDEKNYRRVAESFNWYLEKAKEEFRTHSNPASIQKAVEDDYLRKKSIDGETVYFPTEKSIRAMCNERFEDVMYSMALHTGVSMGTGHRRVPPEYAD